MYIITTMRSKSLLLISIVVVLNIAFATIGATILTAERTSSIAVTTDTDGALSLQANSNVPFVDNTGTNQTLEIDTSSNAGNGINPNATLFLGDADFTGTGSVNTHAYNITNNIGQSANITIEYDAGTITDGSIILAASDGTTDQTVEIDSASPAGTIQFSSVPSGQTIDVALRADTGTAGTDLGGTIRHSAD